MFVNFCADLCNTFLGRQGLMKYITLMSNHERIYDKVRFLGKVYASNTDDNSPNLKTLKVWSDRGCKFARYSWLK